ncbi:hypothetical protein R1flu_011454 [Riccia fluitans]|uniref:2-oxoglutarate dehydrogenase, mitochondrial n=1 Tax=Riccia fluitans TaxID=41844 RepID=A0ABD1ZB43_9MARC
MKSAQVLRMLWYRSGCLSSKKLEGCARRSLTISNASVLDRVLRAYPIQTFLSPANRFAPTGRWRATAALSKIHAKSLHRAPAKRLGTDEIKPMEIVRTKQFHGSDHKNQSAPAPRRVPLSHLKDNFLDGTSSNFLEELQRMWEQDPSSVDASWQIFFKNFTGQSQPSLQQPTSVQPAVAGNQSLEENMRVLLLIRAYQVNGHMKAQLDPLGLDNRAVPQELDPAYYKFSENDMDREFSLGVAQMGGVLSENSPPMTLRTIIQRLEKAYCSTVGYEYMHMSDREKCNWLRERIESHGSRKFSQEQKAEILDRLMWSTNFENFLAQKWTAAKRFGLEGCETLIPGMKELIDKAADLGVESVVIGMAHRGRLNVLGNVVRKPLRQIFNEFSGGIKPAEVEAGGYTGSGDVKYHLGTSYDRPTRSGKHIHLSLVANPSHLEAVAPVVIGKTRAKQYYSQDTKRLKHMAVLLHGDGSFSGQGVVYETLHLSDLVNYSTGGTIHIVVNNQVAFTTDPKSSRSSPYCTDVAKALCAPIIHVNGDDVEAVVHACELAAEWRCKFHADVVVDIVCYRKFGHNEIDEPNFTQPKMYQVIKSHKPSLDSYIEKLTREGEISADKIKSMQDRVMSMINDEFNQSKTYVPKKRDWLAAFWAGFKGPEQLSRVRNTGVDPEILKQVGKKITQIPSTFTPHRAIKKIYEQRAQMIESKQGVDWATAEALAFGTLVVEGNHVRLSGQDVERGTFSHRHAVLHDQKTGERFCPLHHVVENQAQEMFTVSNSSLSEFGVLGFELGYSMENPNSLVLWEGQFGDFANGAQVIFDQFLSSGEAKWLRQTGLTVLLPHGYDGQGPEHSSARLERFLQMSDDDPYIIPEMEASLRKQIQEVNWQVVNVTTPANYFHVLRRQIHRDFRKPLVVMSPKTLLRHQSCKSNLSDFDNVEGHPGFDKQGTRFKRLIKDQNNHSDNEPGIRRLVLCSGKVYYELEEERNRLACTDVAICRIEQLCPFPYDLVQRELKRYSNAEIVWCQEEPMNMGPYQYVALRLGTTMTNIGRGHFEDIKYVGRPTSAATATGFGALHNTEQKGLVRQALQKEPLD